MSQNSIGSFFTAVALAATSPFMSSRMGMGDSEYQPYRDPILSVQSNKSGPLMVYYPHSSEEYIRTKHDVDRIDHASMAMQSRFQALKRSFIRYCDGLPAGKMGYFTLMANALCKLDFSDNVSSYNKGDASIDMVLKLSNGLTLSISSFIDDAENAPMVFSLHRGHTLLVADEMPITEIVRTINSVTA